MNFRRLSSVSVTLYMLILATLPVSSDDSSETVSVPDPDNIKAFNEVIDAEADKIRTQGARAVEPNKTEKKEMMPVPPGKFITPPEPLEPHCEDIKLFFKAAGFKGYYRKRINIFTFNGCRGDLPVPEPGDNMKRLNGVIAVMHDGMGVRLVP